ncbi:MAG: PilZ domain-containing protein [Sphingobium sp.]
MKYSPFPAPSARPDRVIVDIPVMITSVLSSPAEATIANLTEDGSLITGASLPKGTPFQIEYAGQVVYGIVMWAEQDRFGARFSLGLNDGPLHDRLQQARIQQGMGHPHGHAVRPVAGFGRRGLN